MQADPVCSCVQYFDGIATFEEISYRSGMQRRELDKILQLFPDDVSLFCRLSGYEVKTDRSSSW